jgi:phenylalanyl-tRNA synthetase beta chain
VANVATNLKRRQNRVRVFETGRCFFRDPQGGPVAGFRQPWKLTALAYGTALPEQWGSAARHVDFFDLKGDLETLLAPLVARFEKAEHPALHPGRCALVLVAGKGIGFVGELHPQWQQKYELPLAPVLFELDLDASRWPRCRTTPRFHASRSSYATWRSWSTRRWNCSNWSRP